jgi:hypothetical protein
VSRALALKQGNPYCEGEALQDWPSADACVSNTTSGKAAQVKDSSDILNLSNGAQLIDMRACPKVVSDRSPVSHSRSYLENYETNILRSLR